MEAMNEVGKKLDSVFKAVRDVTVTQGGMTPLHKLLVLTIVVSIMAQIMEVWSLLMLLIVSMTGLAYLTEQALTTAWLTSADPVSRGLEWLEACRGSLTDVHRRIFSGHAGRQYQALRERSESIASSHIPDLDVDLDFSSAGSAFQKKIRLELNSIVLLIIRDFVQFWYHKFSYNSQFLKDSRQFLIRALHNLVDRTSRLGPHRTSGKVIHAYQEHLSSFQTAKNLMTEQEKRWNSPKKKQQKEYSKFKRLASVDEAFDTKFKLHPALKSKEAEKQYLRSLMKIILLCSCSRDVVSAQTAQLFFVEVMSVKVLLPLFESLSDPDQLYEILIKLTYIDSDVILRDDTVPELIDLEVKKMQLASTDGVHQLMTPASVSLVTPQNVDGSQGDNSSSNLGQNSNETQQDEASGRCEISRDLSSCIGEDPDTNSQSKQSSAPPSETTASGKGKGGNSTVCDREETESPFSDQSVTENSEGGSSSTCVSRIPVKDISDGTKMSSAIGPDNRGQLNIAEEVTSKEAKTDKAGQRKSSVNSVSEQCDSGEAESDVALPPSAKLSDAQSVGKATASGGSSAEVAESSTIKHSNHLYGEIVSTNIPAVNKPKLQAFKDLFKSKKSKQQELDGRGDPNTEKEQKNQTETNGKSLSDSILPKSLRLSPLLSRANRWGSSAGSSSESASSVSAAAAASEKAAAGKKRSDSEESRQSPSPLPTPSPSQPSKGLIGGPLSFFKFRKPTLEFRKSSPPAVDPVASSVDTSSSDPNDSAVSESNPQQPSLTIPSLRVTNEIGATSCETKETQNPTTTTTTTTTPTTTTTAPTTTPTTTTTTFSPETRFQSVSVSSYDEITEASDFQPSPHDKKKPSLLFGGLSAEEGELEEEAEEVGEEAERGEGGLAGVVAEGGAGPPPDSSFIFQDIGIPSTVTCTEFRSNAQFTVYQIEYEAMHFSETGNPVLKTGTAKRRYREFVNLMSRLEDNPAYKRFLKDVKGPKRWLTLPFKNMDKDSVAGRQKNMEQFLKSLIQVEALCNGPELREFLAYEGDSHIAFVKKATEINVPRIDKMLARTVSGVFDKLKSLPNLPQEVISGIRGREAPVVSERKQSVDADTDTDGVCVVTDFNPDLSLDNMVRDVAERFVHQVQTQGHPDPTPASPTSRLLSGMGSGSGSGSSLAATILQQVPRVEGDGAESPDTHLETGGGGRGQLLLCDALMDLVVQLLVGERHWLCHQRVVTALTNIVGTSLDEWLHSSVSALTTEERCLYYVRLLRETLWPGGKFFSSDGRQKSPQELTATRNVAKKLMLDFLPGAVSGLVGQDSMDTAVEQILESLQYSTLNKHFLYSTVDSLLESLFPEIADPKFQSRLVA